MIPRAELEELLAAEGISVKDNVLLRAELEECARASAALGAPVEEVRIPYDSNPQSVLCRALTGQLAVPNWARFTADLTEIFESVAAEVHGGRCADYIPILAASDPRKFAVSVTTVDGQRMHLGDASADVTLQSCMKPFLYSIAAEDAGLESVHRFVGYEPSGMTFNEVTLNDEGLPHNPMINAGAIATCAVLCRGRGPAERFQFFTDRARALAGGGDVGFSQATYLSEMETTYRNTALVHVMTEYGALPRRVNPRDALDLYIQLCSVECSTSTVATMAATLANGGLCPLTGVKCLSRAIVKSCLSLVFSCGMYDYSGTWASLVGLPAKSSVSGLIWVVIPGVAGLAIWSVRREMGGGCFLCRQRVCSLHRPILSSAQPPLDQHGNSVRGVEFCKRLLRKYPFGIFASMVLSTWRSLPMHLRGPALAGPGHRSPFHSSGPSSPTFAGRRQQQERQEQRARDQKGGILAWTGVATGSEAPVGGNGGSGVAGGGKRRKEKSATTARRAFSVAHRIGAIRALTKIYRLHRGLRRLTLASMATAASSTTPPPSATAAAGSGGGSVMVATSPLSRNPTVATLEAFLQTKGIDARKGGNNPMACALLDKICVTAMSRQGLRRGKRSEVTVVWSDLLVEQSWGHDNVVVRALSGQLEVPAFGQFSVALAQMRRKALRTAPPLDLQDAGDEADTLLPDSAVPSAPLSTTEGVGGVGGVAAGVGVGFGAHGHGPRSGLVASSSVGRSVPSTPDRDGADEDDAEDRERARPRDAGGNGPIGIGGAFGSVQQTLRARMLSFTTGGVAAQGVRRPPGEAGGGSGSGNGSRMGSRKGSGASTGGEGAGGGMAFGPRRGGAFADRSSPQATRSSTPNNAEMRRSVNIRKGGALATTTATARFDPAEALHVEMRRVLGLSDADSGSFEVAVCTCDGQQISLTGDGQRKGCVLDVDDVADEDGADADDGARSLWSESSVAMASVESETRFPLTEAVFALLYLMALEDAGYEATHQWVAAEPTSFDTDGFDLIFPGAQEPSAPPPAAAAAAAAGSAGAGGDDELHPLHGAHTPRASAADSGSPMAGGMPHVPSSGEGMDGQGRFFQGDSSGALWERGMGSRGVGAWRWTGSGSSSTSIQGLAQSPASLAVPGLLPLVGGAGVGSGGVGGAGVGGGAFGGALTTSGGVAGSTPSRMSSAGPVEGVFGPRDVLRESVGAQASRDFLESLDRVEEAHVRRAASIGVPLDAVGISDTPEHDGTQAAPRVRDDNASSSSSSSSSSKQTTSTGGGPREHVEDDGEDVGVELEEDEAFRADAVGGGAVGISGGAAQGSTTTTTTTTVRERAMSRDAHALEEVSGGLAFALGSQAAATSMANASAAMGEGAHGEAGSGGLPVFIPSDPLVRGDPTHPRPFNPFMLSGALTTACIVGLGHMQPALRMFRDAGSRFTYVLERVRAWSGDGKIGFNNAMFLMLKDRALRTRAVAHYLKGLGALPPRNMPDDTASFLLQCECIEMGVSSLAVIAGTIARAGACPVTDKRCARASSVRSLLSMLYSAGLGRHSGRWQFSVGLPSIRGSSGCVMIVVPGVMGMAVYAPTLHRVQALPARVARLCELLVARYRIHVFDQLVYAHEADIDKSTRAALKRHLERSARRESIDGPAGSDGDGAAASDDDQVRRVLDASTLLHLSPGPPGIGGLGAGLGIAMTTSPPASAATTTTTTTTTVGVVFGELMRAAADDDDAAVKALLGSLAPSRANELARHSDWDGRTPLHVAAALGCDSVIRTLLTHGADPNARDRRGHTPIDESRAHGNRDITRMMVQVAASIRSDVVRGPVDPDPLGRSMARRGYYADFGTE